MSDRLLRNLQPVLAFLVVGVILNFTVEYAAPQLNELLKESRYLIPTVAASCVITLLAWYAYREQHERNLKAEFALFTTSELLKPEDVGFKSCAPGDEVPGNIRPYYTTYIPRTAIRYDERHHDKPSRTYRERDLVAELAEGTILLLIGNPTDGKTRTLYEVVRRLENFIVIRTRSNRAPSDDALQLLANKNVVYLLDDLNTDTDVRPDPNEIYDKILRTKARCALAAACRNGPQLAALNTPRSAIQRLYESFALQLQLTKASKEQENQLIQAVGQVADGAVTTLGSICMAGTLRDMHIRFTRDGLAKEVQACHMAIQLLATGNVMPFTHRRIQGVLADVFQRPLSSSQVRDALATLEQDGFLRSSAESDPVIIGDEAYFVGPTARPFYLRNRPAESDLPLLSSTLKRLDDAEGLFYLALSRGEQGEKDNFAFEIDHYDQLASHFQNHQDLASRQWVGWSLYNKGFRLGQLGRSKDEIACYNEVENRFDSAPALELCEQVAKTLNNKGVALRRIGESENAIACYNEVDKRFGSTPELDVREQLAKALFNKGITFAQLNRPKEAIECYDELDRRFGSAPELVLREQVAKALNNKGITWEKIRRHVENEIACFDEVDKRFGSAPELVLREQVAKALFNKGVTFGQLDQSENAINCYDEIDKRFGAAPELVLREQVAKALNNKGVRFSQLGIPGNAINCFDEVDKRFASAPDLVLREQVAKALCNKGVTVGSIPGRSEDAIACYNEVDKRFGSARESVLRESVATALHNNGARLIQICCFDDATICLKVIIERYSESQEPELMKIVELAHDALKRTASRT